MFKVGQKVVCIKPAGEFLKLNKEYIITSVLFCDCGRCLVSWGLVFGESGRVLCNCSKTIDSLDEYYCHANRFAPLDETFATETLAEIAEQIESEQLIIK